MKEMITFTFFIPNQPEGKAKQNLSQFLQKASGVRDQITSHISICRSAPTQNLLRRKIQPSFETS